MLTCFIALSPSAKWLPSNWLKSSSKIVEGLVVFAARTCQHFNLATKILKSFQILYLQCFEGYIHVWKVYEILRYEHLQVVSVLFKVDVVLRHIFALGRGRLNHGAKMVGHHSSIVLGIGPWPENCMPHWQKLVKQIRYVMMLYRCNKQIIIIIITDLLEKTNNYIITFHSNGEVTHSSLTKCPKETLANSRPVLVRNHQGLAACHIAYSQLRSHVRQNFHQEHPAIYFQVYWAK